MADPTQMVRIRIWPVYPLDLAISGESELLCFGEEIWLEDCLCYYRLLIDSLEKLHEDREAWRLKIQDLVRACAGDIVWMPKQFWSVNDG